MAKVSLIDIEKRYGNHVVIPRLSAEIADGAFVVLVGPSGCGKSTTLQMIAGLEPITAGQLRIGDRDVTDLPPKDRDIAMVFQSYALFPHLTVFDNIAFGLKIGGSPGVKSKRRCGELPTVCASKTISSVNPRRCPAVSVNGSRWLALWCGVQGYF